MNQGGQVAPAAHHAGARLTILTKYATSAQPVPQVGADSTVRWSAWPGCAGGQTGPVQLSLTSDEKTTAASVEEVRRARDAGHFFWLDVQTSDGDEQALASLLLGVFDFHPLAVEDAQHFGQRPKLDDYDDFAFLVVHGVTGAGAPATDRQASDLEVHLFLTAQYLVTVHRGDCPALGNVRTRLDRHRESGNAPQIVLTYLVVDELTDSFFPVLSTFDDRVDDLEAAILAQPTEEQLGELFSMKRQLIGIRRMVTAQRDTFASLTSGVTTLPGMTADSARYFRDLYDHLIRIADTVDSYRDLLSGVMDTHLSTVSNRLNVVMKQLAIIATVFLPLSFLTGFFGQNFSVLVNGIVGWPAFLGLGLGLELVAVAALMALFKRRGWLGGPAA